MFLLGNGVKYYSNNYMIIVSHPLGNQNVREAVKGIDNANLLHSFITSVANFPGTKLDILSKKYSFLSEYQKRTFNTSIKDKTYTYPYKEMARIISLKLGLQKFTKHEVGAYCVDEVCKYIDLKTAKHIKKFSSSDLCAVFAYEDIAYNSFKAAKVGNLKCYYDLPIGYWRAARELMQSEIYEKPEWASTMVGFHDSSRKLEKKDLELELADHIFVASSFTKKTLSRFPGQLNEISVIPYGFPAVNYEKKNFSKMTRLKILFVGGLSQRKGIENLFSAVNKIGRDHVELTIVGGKIGGFCEVLEKELLNCNYIPKLPHSDILKLMRTQDVFVFPSLFEGFGLVITEAMSQGLPVITTDRTIGPDIINSGENGYIIEAGNTELLITALEEILLDRKKLEHFSKSGLEIAANRDWSVYGEELASKLSLLMT